MLSRTYSFIPGGYKLKKLRVSQYILNAGYFPVLIELFSLCIQIDACEWPNKMRIESVNYSVSNPCVYLLSMSIANHKQNSIVLMHAVTTAPNTWL